MFSKHFYLKFTISAVEAFFGDQDRDDRQKTFFVVQKCYVIIFPFET